MLQQKRPADESRSLGLNLFELAFDNVNMANGTCPNTFCLYFYIRRQTFFLVYECLEVFWDTIKERTIYVGIYVCWVGFVKR